MRPEASPEEQAADDLLDRLDDLYDQRPNALQHLIAAIDRHIGNLEASDIRPLAVRARATLLTLDPDPDDQEVNRLALEYTDDLRLACAARASGF